MTKEIKSYDLTSFVLTFSKNVTKNEEGFY